MLKRKIYSDLLAWKESRLPKEGFNNQGPKAGWQNIYCESVRGFFGVMASIAQIKCSRKGDTFVTRVRVYFDK